MSPQSDGLKYPETDQLHHVLINQERGFKLAEASRRTQGPWPDVAGGGTLRHAVASHWTVWVPRIFRFMVAASAKGPMLFFPGCGGPP